jgi:hypothetical protein
MGYGKYRIAINSIFEALIYEFRVDDLFFSRLARLQEYSRDIPIIENGRDLQCDGSRFEDDPSPRIHVFLPALGANFNRTIARWNRSCVRNPTDRYIFLLFNSFFHTLASSPEVIDHPEPAHFLRYEVPRSQAKAWAHRPLWPRVALTTRRSGETIRCRRCHAKAAKHRRACRVHDPAS